MPSRRPAVTLSRRHAAVSLPSHHLHCCPCSTQRQPGTRTASGVPDTAPIAVLRAKRHGAPRNGRSRALDQTFTCRQAPHTRAVMPASSCAQRLLSPARRSPPVCTHGERCTEGTAGRASASPPCHAAGGVLTPERREELRLLLAASVWRSSTPNLPPRSTHPPAGQTERADRARVLREAPAPHVGHAVRPARMGGMHWTQNGLAAAHQAPLRPHTRSPLRPAPRTATHHARRRSGAPRGSSSSTPSSSS